DAQALEELGGFGPDARQGAGAGEEGKENLGPHGRTIPHPSRLALLAPQDEVRGLDGLILRCSRRSREPRRMKPRAWGGKGRARDYIHGPLEAAPKGPAAGWSMGKACS